ncbi:hypothetical protein J1N35_011453 [Gossypium stocksii]|uniref:Uncharacterized protein n=1 Tax=Gossypium stocksii TaxID=47602 RepID=A0A9D4ADF1_9ROSI|nr:hypothetical protein J1N35_011453 [Gossypium stocksii]
MDGKKTLTFRKRDVDEFVSEVIAKRRLQSSRVTFFQVYVSIFTPFD